MFTLKPFNHLLHGALKSSLVLLTLNFSFLVWKAFIRCVIMQQQQWLIRKWNQWDTLPHTKGNGLQHFIPATLNTASCLLARYLALQDMQHKKPLSSLTSLSHVHNHKQLRRMWSGLSHALAGSAERFQIESEGLQSSCEPMASIK